MLFLGLRSINKALNINHNVSDQFSRINNFNTLNSSDSLAQKLKSLYQIRLYARNKTKQHNKDVRNVPDANKNKGYMYKQLLNINNLASID